jgi:hypothetical protein
MIYPLLVTTFTKIPKDDELVSGLRMKMDVDAGEWLKGSYKMWLYDPNHILFKFPGLSLDMIQWEQRDYDRARRDMDCFDEAMENQDSVQRRASSSQVDAGFQYFLLKFGRTIDNDIFFDKEEAREIHSELDKREINAQLTVFTTAKPVPLPEGVEFKNIKSIWRVAWIIAFDNERIAQPAAPIASQLAGTKRWMNNIQGQFSLPN